MNEASRGLGSPPRLWVGVHTRFYGRVGSNTLSFTPALELSTTGSIPARLAKLAALERLVLNKNQLTGPIPATLGKLAALKRLLLTKNHLTGE
ncbi:unnamed protein product [Hapterophycus canaliculatus]